MAVHKTIESTMLVSVILAVLFMEGIAVGQPRLQSDRKRLYQQGRTSYEQARYEEAIDQYVKFLKRYQQGKYVYQARYDLLELFGGVKHDVGWLLKQEAVSVVIDAYKNSPQELIRDRAEWILVMAGLRHLIEERGKPSQEDYPRFFSAFGTWWETQIGKVEDVKGLTYYSESKGKVHTIPITVDNVHKVRKIAEIRTVSRLDAKVHWLFHSEAGGELGAGINNLGFSPDGQLLAWGDYRGNLKIWQIKPGGKGRTIESGSIIAKHFGIERSGYGLSNSEFLAIDPSNRLLCSTLGFWEISSGEPVRGPKLEDHREKLGRVIYAASFSPDGRLIMAGDALSVWDIQRHKLLAVLQESLAARGLYIDTISLTPNGKALAAANAGMLGLVKVWEMDSFRELSRFSLGFVRALALSPDGKLLATNAHKPSPRIIALWDVKTGQQVAKLEGDIPEESVDFLAFTPDGQMLVSSTNVSDDETRVSMFLDSWYNSRSNTVFWDVASHNSVWRLQRKVFRLCTNSELAVSPDGHLIAAADEELEVVFLYGVLSDEKP